MNNNTKWTPGFEWYKKVYPSIPEDELKKMYEEQSGNKVPKWKQSTRL